MSKPDDSPLSQDLAFDLLSNSRRRFVIRRLQEESGEIELGELASELAARENDVSIDQLNAQQRKRTYVSLYQTHIPKMVEAGVITYDRDDGTVAATDRVSELAAYFRTQSTEPAWELVYGGLALAGVVVYVLIQSLGVAVVGPIHVALVVLLLIAVVSVVHYLYENKLDRTDGLVPVDEE